MVILDCYWDIDRTRSRISCEVGLVQLELASSLHQILYQSHNHWEVKLVYAIFVVWCTRNECFSWKKNHNQEDDVGCECFLKKLKMGVLGNEVYN